MASSEARKLYGTEQPPVAVDRLTAGPLSIDLEGGAVRYVRFGGHEAIRGIDYLVRDSSWRTPAARLTPVRREISDAGFTVALDGEVRQEEIHYRYRLTIEGSADGSLEVTADAEALNGFLTNRTGFVVLHPIVGVAGRPVTVTHKDGSTSETSFPELISPGQPIFDIRALRHEVAPGLFVTCLMEAALPQDPETIYEMEDQRNWTDASYKTYVGSLLDSWPYRIEAGQKVRQRIALSFEGRPPAGNEAAAGGPTVRFGDGEHGRVPAIGMGVLPQYRHGLGAANHPARRLKPQFLTCYAECADAGFAPALKDYAALARDYGVPVQLELVLPKEYAPTARLMADAAKACAEAGLEPARLVPCPAPYLKSVQPVGPWPEVVDLGHIYNQARLAFPDAVLLGGMLSYFTELNRKRPSPATIDGISCTTTPIVHAADDTSVMETHEALPAVIASMRAMAGGRPVHIGPSAIGMRHNPYGVATADNPDAERVAMAEDDPRQRGLFAAAWAVGYAGALAEAGIAALALNHLAGPSGVSGADGSLYPVFHVMAVLCGAGGSPVVPVTVEGAGLAGVAWRAEGRIRVLLANQTALPLAVTLPKPLDGRVLDSASFDAAARDPSWSEASGGPIGPKLELAPYATLFGTL